MMRVMVVHGVSDCALAVVMDRAWANGAAHGAGRSARFREDAPDGDEAASAVRAAAEATVSLRWAARCGWVFVCQSAADISIGHDVAMADDHYRSSLEQFK